MSNNMELILKPKYDNFIKIIDNYENTEKTCNNSNKSSKSTKSHNSCKENKINNEEENETNTKVENETNTKVENETNTKVENETNTEEGNKMVSEKENNKEIIFQKLHEIILKHPKIIEEKPKKDKVNIENLYSEKSDDDIKYIIKNNKDKKEKNKKSSIKSDNSSIQREKLELLYNKKISENEKTNSKTNNKTNKKHKTKYRDELKKICKQFEEKCVMESTRGFNVKDDLYYINMDILTKNTIDFNKNLKSNYECIIFYRSYKDNKVILNPNKNIGWLEISKKGEQNINSKNKYLSTSLRLFETTDKYRKTINGEKVRAFKNIFYVYKTNIKLDIIVITKEINN
jgi:hypothetical protein